MTPTSVPATPTKPETKDGFSLIEVLLALVILGILIATLSVALNGLLVVDMRQAEQAESLLQRKSQSDRNLLLPPSEPAP